MLNLKVPSSREAGHVVQEMSQRLDANSCRWELCQKYTLCVQVRGLGPVDDGGVQTAATFSARDLHQEGIQHPRGLQKYLLQNTCWAWRTAWNLWGLGGGAALTAGPPRGPHWNETSEIGLFFLLSLLPSPTLLPCLWRFLLKYLILPNFVINLNQKNKWSLLK